jgi:signal transduction histidine kinase
LQVHSVQGQGTTVQITLPICEKPFG